VAMDRFSMIFRTQAMKEEIVQNSKLEMIGDNLLILSKNLAIFL
jgi:hypothetical protein